MGGSSMCIITQVPNVMCSSALHLFSQALCPAGGLIQHGYHHIQKDPPPRVLYKMMETLSR